MPGSASAPLRIFLSTADHSGDQHAAALMEEVRGLRPQAEFAGIGGPEMEKAGCRLLADATRHSAMWFDVFREAGRLWRLLREVERFWRSWPPDLFVPIDSPGLNFPLARRARGRGVSSVYYFPPQTWAWGRWRVRKLKRLFDRLLVTLPFEEEFYRRRGARVDYVGHPLFDYLPRRHLAGDLREELGLAPEEALVGVLPGSRRSEVRRLMPLLRDAALEIRRKRPGTRFAVGAAHRNLVPLVEEALRGSDLDAPVLLNRTLELMRDARLCLVASGTATLQLLHFATPMVIVYRLNAVEWWIMRLFKRSRYIGLVNVLAERGGSGSVGGRGGGEGAPPVPLAPELVSRHHRPGWVADRALELLEDTTRRRATVEALQALKAEVDHPGALRRAAEALVASAGERK